MKTTMRLNVFQQLMRLWTEVAPYNAGTILRIAGPLEVERWRLAVQRLIEETGLGLPEFASEEWVHFTPPLAITIEERPNLKEALNEECNRPFASGEMPLRFLVCPGETEQSHYFTVIFDHWLTDGGTIAEFVVRLVVRYAALDAVIGLVPPRPHSYALQTMREAARVRSEHREVQPLGPEVVSALRTHFVMERWPVGLFEALQKKGRTWGGTGHDMLIAAVAQQISEGEGEISLVSVTDVRQEAKVPMTGALGQFISFTTCVLASAKERSLEELTREVAQRTQRGKSERRALRNFGALEAAAQGWRRAQSVAEKLAQFHQLAPLAAGVSQMNVTRLHREIGRCVAHYYGGQGNDYHRASPLLEATVLSPTGPLTPLLLTVNKLHPESVMMGLSYRTVAMSEASAKLFLQRLVNTLREKSGL
jgi:hypothetical protein